MDPVTLVVTALAIGGASVSRDGASAEIKEAYGRLRDAAGPADGAARWGVSAGAVRGSSGILA
jgi:hypothetical protein